MYNNELLDAIIKNNHIDEKGKAFRAESLKEFDASDYPVWKRAKIKTSTVPEYKPYKNQKVLWHKQSGLSVLPIYQYSGAYDMDSLKKAYGPSQKHRTQALSFSNTGTVIEVEPSIVVAEPIIIQLELNKDNPLIIDHHIIHAGVRSEVVVIVDYSEVGDIDLGYQNGVINIIAEEGSKVQVVKIQNFSRSTTHISGGLSVVARDAEVRFNSIDLGAAIVVTDYSAYLEDENAKGYVESVYLGDGKTKLDIGYNIYHNGRRSESKITVKGALQGEAGKVFRGNLFFRKGAKRSVGSEQEYVILLDERVRADSIPALMCDEDDVQGEHAASAGQVDNNKLFYLMSRGLTEKEAKQLIITASFAPVIDLIPVEGLRDRISNEIGLRLN